MKFDDVLGFHGVVLRTRHLEEDALRWRQALGARVLKRTTRSITLGLGPEFFLELRRAGRAEAPGLEELHVAVQHLKLRDPRTDPLGGVSVRRAIAATTLVLREFMGPSSGAWRPARKPRRK